MATTKARILCIGPDIARLICIVSQLDTDLEIVVVACPEEGNAALLSEPAYNVIISDDEMPGIEAILFLARLRAHSPGAERVVFASQADHAALEMAASDARVMRVLERPCEESVLREAVADAILRHRARAFRASAVPRVTPMGAHPCCVYDGTRADEGVWEVHA